jgi:cobalt-zinc-cadmium efflux system protein
LGVGVALPPTTAARRAGRDDQRTFGLYRAEVLAALANAVLLFAVAGWVLVEAVQRFADPPEVPGLPVMLAAAAGLVANLVAFALLRDGAKESLNLRGAYLEVLGDLIGSMLVIVAALVILSTGFEAADPIASILIAALIVPRALSLLRDVLHVLFESAPSDTDVAEIREHLIGTAGVVAVHDVHVWQITSGSPVFSAHVEVQPEVFASGRAGDLLDELGGCLSEHFDVAHSTFQLEPAGRAEQEQPQHP